MDHQDFEKYAMQLQMNRIVVDNYISLIPLNHSSAGVNLVTNLLWFKAVNTKKTEFQKSIFSQKLPWLKSLRLFRSDRKYPANFLKTLNRPSF